MEGLVDADEARFGPDTVNGIIKASKLPLNADAVREYCRWFVGSAFGWATTLDGTWSASYGNHEQREHEWQEELGHHLAGDYRCGLRRFALHMRAKSSEHDGRVFHWTRFVAIDLDRGPDLGSRYAAVVAAYGTKPLVLRSPSRGLHLYFPLLEPVSIFGNTYGQRRQPPRGVELLNAAGLAVVSGVVEVFPAHKRTLRMPLAGGTAQLDPNTLAELPAVSRDVELDRLVTTMTELTPVDLKALADALPHEYQLRAYRPPKTKVRTVQKPVIGGELDIPRLMSEGLYGDVKRHRAALAVAWWRMVVDQQGAEATVEYLLGWTADKLGAAGSYEAEYRRICKGITAALESGKIARRPRRPVGRPITDTDIGQILATTDGLERKRRYAVEVFLCCFMGFTKDLGKPDEGPAEPNGLVPMRAEVPTTTMSKWPSAAAGRYRRYLDVALDAGVVEQTRNYRRCNDHRYNRARTYRLKVDMSVTAGLDTTALRSVAAEHQVHPRQVEHAVLANTHVGNLQRRYTRTSAKRIEALAHAYALATKPETVMLVWTPKVERAIRWSIRYNGLLVAA